MIILILQIKKKFTKGVFKFLDLEYEFEDWDRNAQIDGWVCRNDEDCTWIDDKLGCDDRDFNLQMITVSIVETMVVIMFLLKIIYLSKVPFHCKIICNCLSFRAIGQILSKTH